MKPRLMLVVIILMVYSSTYFSTSCSPTKNEDTAKYLSINPLDTISINLSEKKLDTLDWGKVKLGTTVFHYIKLNNDLPDLLFLNRVKTGDGGCYVDNDNHPVSNEPIYPNGSFTFRIRQITHKKRSGSINKTVCLRLQIPNEGEVLKCFEYQGQVFKF